MSADLRCTSTPISWLRLEQHAVGELDSATSAEITAHLASCAACASCLRRIEAGALAPLPALAPAPAPALGPAPAPARIFSFPRFAPALAAFAVAAAILLFLRRGTDSDPERSPDPFAAHTKGGDVSFVLVREDEGLVAEAGGIYRDGDRWKALVTCPVGMHASWDLAVFEGQAEAAFPLSPRTDLACGNAVALPGAFRTTGRERMTVCLVWNDGALVDRGGVRHASPEALPHSTCKTLDPAP